MKESIGYKINGELYTLQSNIELYATLICESMTKKEKTQREILDDCKILDSLSRALIAIKL